MTTGLINVVTEFVKLSWLTGPIFDKELRVSSRRRRNYVLRFAYLALMTIFLVLVWLEEVQYSGSSVYRISRMARAGQTIIMFIIWFQFLATQLIAVIMLSTSISDEIYNRTLGLLMTTPINSFQIVMGKLFSKLLQLILFLAISLPLLAIVRVFGGVPWNYVISSLCITLTTVIFVGSLSLFFSIFSRRAYIVIIMTFLTLGMVFALIPLLVSLFWHSNLQEIISEKTLFTVLFHPNPYAILAFSTEAMMLPGMGGRMPFYSWPLHCGIMLAASTVILAVSVSMVRKVALRQATGQIDVSSRKGPFRKKEVLDPANQQDFTAVPRRVKGPPVIWKELRLSLLGRRKIATLIGIFVCLSLLFTAYWLCFKEGILDDEGTHMLYAVIFMALGIMFTIIYPATSITSEKESRSWPLLLTTTIDDGQILFGKFVGILRRCLPIWIFLFGHVIIFSLAGYIHPFAIIQIDILVVWIVVFLSGTGLYFSSCFKRTTTAVIMNFALAATIWGILPLLMTIVVSINAPFTRNARDFVEDYMDTNPFVHTAVIIEATANENPVKIGSYGWIGSRRTDVVQSTSWMLACMAGYISLGAFFAWRAKCRFRHDIF
ncbi:MAG: ABC transporter permease [Planctomycetota bacterium]|jgi:ABC-type transport system involved in multi-copper enzyme maturation permease subunit